MKRRQLFISMLLIISFYGFLHAQEGSPDDGPYADIINEIVFPFFTALKNGDVSSIKQYIAGDMYESRRILLEQNTEYPEFLRKYYQGVEFYVDNAQGSGDYVLIQISIEYPNGDYGSGELYLWQINHTTEGRHEIDNWKIIDFIYN
jgi:hypothetical protein